MTNITPETAVIVVDTQNDFALPEGRLAVPNGEQVIPPLNRLTAAARAAGSLVLFTRDFHPEETPHFKEWPVHCVGGTEGAELHPDLNLEAGDLVLDKGQGQTDGYSGFEALTQEDDPQLMETVLQKRGIRAVLIGGLATDYCVKATAIDATNRNFETRLLTDAVQAVDSNEGDGQKAIEEMTAAGVVLTTTEEVFEETK